jgi:tripartite ATP-independent transporter DctM subunit
MLLFLGSKYLVNFSTVAFNRGTDQNQLVVPLFILMAEFFSRGDIASGLFHVASKLTKRIKGGLAVATTLTCTIFAALCGSSPATAATIGRVASGEMTKRGYTEAFAIGTVAGGGTLGIMIPPSITFVMFGMLTETSIVKLLMAGLLPGIMLSFLMCSSIVIRARLNPSLIGEDRPDKEPKAAKKSAGPATAATATATRVRTEIMEEAKTTWIQDVIMVLPAMLLILLVLGSIYTGAATATEASGVGAVGAFLLIVFRKKLTKKHFVEAVASTAKTSSMMILMLTGGFCLTQVVSRCGIANDIAIWIVSSGINKWLIMVMLYAMWYVLGCLMDPSAMVVLTIPFIFPALVALGFDPLWIGVVSTLCVEVGMITPPVGLNLFILKTTSDFQMGNIIKGAFPYVLVLTLGLAILTIFPQIALILPSRM